MTSGTSYSPPPAFGRFRLLHQIGAGVLGPVFRTHDEQDGRLVAVKAFTLDITPERAEELSNRLQHIVEIDLEHPHIARPIATGVEDSVAYLALQYVEGESLDAAIRQYGPAPANDVLRVIGHIAEALDVAAGVGVFHGSLHPRDILVTPVETRVTGLGVSMALEGIGQHGPIRRPYAAPERESGQEWGAAADVFSLAVIAYEVLTGRRALPGTEQPFPGLAELQVRDVAALRELLESAVDPEPNRRPAKAGDFAAALAPALVDAGAAQASGERGSGARRKVKARAPKLPGLDDPLIPEEAAVHAAPADPTPAGGRASDPPAPIEMPTLPETHYDPTDDRDASGIASDRRVAPVMRLELGPIAPEPAVPLLAESIGPSELPMRLTPYRDAFSPVIVTPPPAAPPPEEPADAETRSASSYTPPEPPEPSFAPPRSAGPDSSVDDARDAGPLGLDLPVPRALDPTRGDESYLHASRRFEPVQEPRTERSLMPIVVAAAAGVLLGLLGGYEIGARWGQHVPAPAAATQPASATVPAIAPPVMAPAAVPLPVPAAPVPPRTAAPEASVPAASPPAPAKPTAAAPARPKRPVAAPVPAKRAAAATPVPAKPVPAKPAAAAATPAKRPAQQIATVSFASRPAGARVILDGKDVGITPLTLNKVAPGRHAIELRLAGFGPWTTSITVAAGKPQRVAASLERNK